MDMARQRRSHWFTWYALLENWTKIRCNHVTLNISNVHYFLSKAYMIKLWQQLVSIIYIKSIQCGNFEVIILAHVVKWWFWHAWYHSMYSSSHDRLSEIAHTDYMYIEHIFNWSYGYVQRNSFKFDMLHLVFLIIWSIVAHHHLKSKMADKIQNGRHTLLLSKI